MDLTYLNGSYLVYNISWRQQIEGLDIGNEHLPTEYWIDVDMNKRFWKDVIESGLRPTLERINYQRNFAGVRPMTKQEYNKKMELDDTIYETPMQILYSFFDEYLDKVFSHDVMGYDVKTLVELRDEKINEILIKYQKKNGWINHS